MPPPRFRLHLPLAGLALGILTFAAGAPAQEPGEGFDPFPESEQDLAAPPPVVGWKAGRGVFFRKWGADRFRFVSWEGEESINRVFSAMRLWKGGEVHFAPGNYPVEQGFTVSRTPNLTISGSPGVVLEFAPGPEPPPITTAPVGEGDMVIRVDHAGSVHAGWRYQLYSPRRSGARVLEFEVASVEGNEVHLTRPVVFMPMVKEIPVGSRVLAEVNFFRVRDCPGLVIQGLIMDGKGRGPVRGHTLYCGVYATGAYRQGEPPTTTGLTVRGCTFRGLKGRGVCAYGIANVDIESCGFFDIFAQAVEIDHYSSGRVFNNLVDGAECGVMLNDAFSSVVEGNVLQGCEVGVRIVRIFPEDWVNTGNVVRDNLIGPECDQGVTFEDNVGDGISGNVVRGNHFVGLEPTMRVVNGDGNEVRGNSREP